MSKWIKSGEMPPTQRFSMNINHSTNPNLAEWLWSLPFREGAAEVKKVLEAYATQQMANTKKQRPSLKKASPVAVTTDEVKGGKKEKREPKGGGFKSEVQHLQTA